MRPGHARLFWCGALICLPAVLLCLAGAYFLLDRVPTIARRQKARQTRECRRVAERLSESPDDCGYRSAERPKGWCQTGKLKDGSRWGWVQAGAAEATRPDERLVWIESETGGLRGAWCPEDDEPDFELFCYIAVPAVLLTIWLVTLVGLRFFILFARGREDFLVAAAHDLTTPLIGMRMMIGRDDAEALSLNARMLRIVANINDFLKLGGKRPPPRRERIDLVACYREAYSLFAADFRELAGGRDVPVECGGAQDGNAPRFEATGDPTLTVQILWNLLGNDLKYAAPHGEVKVRFSRLPESVVVEFADTGPGMSPRQRRRAFDRYYRVQDVLKSGKGGFGIGLCSAREFARAMGGDLTVRANSPKGCVFTLTLPHS